MKIIQMHEISRPESLAAILKTIDYVAIENGDHKTIQTTCEMDPIASGGYHLKQCPDVIGLFAVNISNGQFTIVGPGNDQRPFYSTRDELRGLLINLLRDAPIWMRLKRWCDTMVCCSCSTAILRFQTMPTVAFIEHPEPVYTI